MGKPGMHVLDDLVSAGLDGLREAIGKFDAKRGASFETWIGRTIFRRIKDEVRRQRKRQAREIFVDFRDEKWSAVAVDTVSESRLQMKLDLQFVLASTPFTDRERKVFQMKADGHTEKEIAAEVGLKSDRAVRYVLSRIKEKACIATGLTGYFDED